ncbi:M61 family metallopeptidase [Pedobacter insulae]|uniref:Predicted metalloprotease, contains C-terminal PDZ domain n=1 Tax=Pedobacter insulae TaxID=414048 RepID=A0A1I2V1D5_9SPHI|nr:M61 family metallopeptidase [Pedobacter insulae]SFG83022.1 Predicted metalloprotease, contains C-terminal PDZ domain [Pedobacter insulae]
MKMQPKFSSFFLLFILFISGTTNGQSNKASRLEMVYTVSMEQPESNTFQVVLNCGGLSENYYDFKIPVWMPGYYQILNYANDIKNLKISDLKGNPVKWDKANHNTWRVYSGGVKAIELNYEVKTNRSFVATNYLNSERAFIAPTGLFMHVADQINVPVTVHIKPYRGWNRIATGLEKIKEFTYHANDFDILYDSPILIGKLEELPFFTVKGVPHYFIGYQLGDFNKEAFMADLKKVIEAAVAVIGDIPFKDYTFIGIGPGGGGIEHLNSSAVAFTGSKSLDKPGGRMGILSFLGHEYFHHYNAKRIRPIELGPFDYDNGSRTNMLWVAEGVTTYYDEMLLRWAKLESSEQILVNFQQAIKKYETSPGSLFQAVSQASYDTWSDGPFGRIGDEVNKTVSYYDKGPVMGMLLDFKIRHETKNKKSLNDVMRTLYYTFYKKENRGYTEDEFRKVCEQTAGGSLAEFFSYIYTVKTPDYVKYLNYAGLTIDVKPRVMEGAWHGIHAAVVNDSLRVRDVDWNSPAWIEGIRRNQVIASINGQPASKTLLDQITKQNHPNDRIKIETFDRGKKAIIPMLLGKKSETSFEIKRLSRPNELQKIILKSWLKE